MTDVGFSIIDNVLSLRECELLAKTIRNADGRAGARNLMSSPAVASLAYDSRMLQLATQALGTHALPFRATLFDKSSGANWHVLWHQDRALPLLKRVECNEWGPWSWKSGVLYALAPAWALERVVALRLHIDASIETNGPLRVIPGSHRNGVINAMQISDMVRDIPAHPCIVGRGGVLAMQPLLLHSSPKMSRDKPRRVLHIEYTNRFDFGNGLRLGVA
jgi:ectoine hydroxylase-related dioxygenase (phytanoyl-CoA dioxygenase family)